MTKRSTAGLLAALTVASGLAAVLPATTATAADARPAAAAPAALRVLPLGDSITWGVGSPSGNSYRGFLANQLTAEGHTLDFVGSGRNGSTADPDNEGHSGWRIDQIAAITDATVARYRPNVVLLEIGTNDLGQNYQVPTATDRLSALIDQITRGAPDATVLVGSVIVSTSGTEEANRPAFNQKLPGIVQAKQSAGKHVRLVDMGALTAADLSDSLHPNDNGFQKMATAFNSGIQAADAAGWVKAPVALGGQVQSGIAGKCMDVNAGSTANGTAVQIWSCNGTQAQWWNAYGDGTLRSTGKCLDASANGTANGTPVEIWDCNGGANQVWQAHNGGYRNPVSGRCLDDPAASTTNGTRLVLWDCNGGANQRWTALQPG
ncbi:ricin-type beta-trefoil lectin domain protein [Kitasatospora sp. NBC_00240]|uniref:ricin-type beta-trefoil lectin domain protein n=1 Tax=Kitasatospora sp. NBC_00240 TaxID=2903567 RepID=UPI0022549190|nr:ricin-type beta-trefoil lectin domain protein [Kitasatospora sp. NBC_00240]MCX5214707.1 ricin-type beta-trefoil lectin domain protein [Kitasatospora sp. NBC_00240]